jgi:hypothetical protein
MIGGVGFILTRQSTYFYDFSSQDITQFNTFVRPTFVRPTFVRPTFVRPTFVRPMRFFSEFKNFSGFSKLGEI